MRKHPHVALLIETSKQYGRGLIAGIGEYLKTHGTWSVFIEERAIEDPVPRWLRRWKGDGIIARVHSDAMARMLLDTGLPVVNVRRFHTRVAMPSVWEDDLNLCELALRHFRDHRFTKFAYCGFPDTKWSQRRGEHFVKVVQGAGVGECLMYAPPKRKGRGGTWEQDQDDLAAWLASLPKPIAILAANDVRGVSVLDAARRISIPVPQQCAVLGVDNETTLCQLTDPSLSSIDQDEEQTGFQAAALLDALMRGEPAPPEPLLIKPLGIVHRASTDSVAVEDAQLAKALRFIRMHACDRVTIVQVAEHIGLSARELQRRFKEILGHSPLDEIFLVQLARIRQLLTDTEMKLSAIAERAGFAYVGHMSTFFKKHTGHTCGEFRRLAREQKGA